jgi:hypothetical protein
MLVMNDFLHSSVGALSSAAESLSRIDCLCFGDSEVESLCVGGISS